MNDLTKSTELGIGNDLLKKIQNTKFCIVGCGGVGSIFAEMLVRTGAINVALIDADKVELKNLNRTLFVSNDVEEYKVEVLKKRLKSINSDINVKAIDRHFGVHIEGDKKRQEIRDLVLNSDITLISVDKNIDRIECEKLLREFNKKYLVIGVSIEKNLSKYVCGWMTKTKSIEEDLEGYGENNGSYMSIVTEAVSAGFNLMMHHIEKEDPKNNEYIERSYKNHFPEDINHEQ